MIYRYDMLYEPLVCKVFGGIRWGEQIMAAFNLVLSWYISESGGRTLHYSGPKELIAYSRYVFLEFSVNP